jgi:hypothetical protein
MGGSSGSVVVKFRSRHGSSYAGEEAEREGLCSDGQKYADCELPRLVDLLPIFSPAESVRRKQIRERDLED